MALITVSPSPCWCCHMDKDRNTGDLVCQVSHGCTGVYLELFLQPKCHHLMVLLGNVLQRSWYHHPMLQWGTGLWWVWHSDTCYGEVKMRHLFPRHCKLCHQHWSVGCDVYWTLWGSHYLSWWTPVGGGWCCGFCICEVRTRHAALVL